MEKLITIDNAHFSYPALEENAQPTEVLKGISLEFEHGELVAVLGHNGSGKSTLAKLMNAILLPTEGSVTVCGMDTKEEEHLMDIRQHIGMVFQNPDNQIVATIVEEDVAFGLENLGVPPDEMRVRVDQALHAVGMYEYRNHEPHQLSGGQKQRVAIAGIIAMRPDCIVLDEPTAMLDPQGRKEVMRTIKMLNRDYGITIILITHEMDEAAQCDRVIVVDSGSVVMDDVPKKVFSQVTKMRELGLDVPQAAELCHLLREAGYDLSPEILDADECIDALAAIFEQKGIM